MKHFEDIWNAAEDIAAQEELGNLQRYEVVAKMMVALDKCSSNGNSEGTHDALGEILFQLCALTRSYNANSALALKMAIEKHKQELLDPDDPDTPD